jgi:hypothetical protein
MTKEEMLRCLKISELDHNDPDAIVGIKIGIRPRDTTLDDRVDYIRDALNAIS